MRPVPLTVELVLDAAGAPWPDCSGMHGPLVYECMFGLNAALARAVGLDGWSFEWESHSALGMWRVPARLETLTAMDYPRPGAGVQAHVTARAMLRTTLVPTPSEAGDLGRRIAGRLEGVVWQYEVDGAEGAALVRVVGVAVSDPLRQPVELYRRALVTAA